MARVTTEFICLAGCYIGVLLFCQNKIIAICVGYRIVDGELLNAMFVCLYYVLTISASQNVFFIKTVDNYLWCSFFNYQLILFSKHLHVPHNRKRVA